MGGSSLVVVLVALAVVLSARSVLAANYNVSGDGGCSPQWAFGCNYTLWSASHNVSVGDQLVFRFDNTSNNVASVSPKAYNTCENGVSISTLLKHLDTSSPTSLKLTSPGDYYFVSLRRAGNGSVICRQKVHIRVGLSSATLSMATTPPPPSLSNLKKLSKKAIIEIVAGVLTVVVLVVELIRRWKELRKKKHMLSVTGEDPVFKPEMDGFEQRKVQV